MIFVGLLITVVPEVICMTCMCVCYLENLLLSCLQRCGVLFRVGMKWAQIKRGIDIKDSYSQSRLLWIDA